MKPVVAVLARTDSFVHVWEDVASSAGARARVADDVEALAPLGEACGVVAAVAGAEDEAADTLAALRVGGAREVVVVGAATDHRLATSMVKAGAADYFALPGDLESLRGWVEDRVVRATRHARARDLAEREREQYDFSNLVARSAGMVAALERAAKVIPRANATVLLTGETGTGKGLLAQAIHYNGPRATRIGPSLSPCRPRWFCAQ